jgi:biotin operon repressor
MSKGQWRVSDMEMRGRMLLNILLHGRAVSGTSLARMVGVSPRTLWRDIKALRDKGHRIDGAAGCGYMLRRVIDGPRRQLGGFDLASASQDREGDTGV